VVSRSLPPVAITVTLSTEGEGFEPPSPCGRQFSSSLGVLASRTNPAIFPMRKGLSGALRRHPSAGFCDLSRPFVVNHVVRLSHDQRLVTSDGGTPAQAPIRAELTAPPEPYQATIGDRWRWFVRGATEPFRVDKTPAWASVIALSLALGPGAIDRYQSGRWDSYDPTVAVLTATLIALIWTAHYTFRSVKHARQVEQREKARRLLAKNSMAVAVIEELDYLKPSLALMHGRIAVSGVRFLERPQLRHALAHIDLFSAPVAADLSRFDSILRQIESHAALYDADHADAVAMMESIGLLRASGPNLLDFSPERVANIRTMIESAQTVIPFLNQRLLEER
jgi:hypothetical protein